MTSAQLASAASIMHLAGEESPGDNGIWRDPGEGQNTGLRIEMPGEEPLVGGCRALAPSLAAGFSDPPVGEEAVSELVGESSGMQEIISFIRQVAPTSVSVLISGESGTGKELAARAIHHLSLRRDGPFVAVNCAALPEALVESMLFGHEKGAFSGAMARQVGCFEQAHNGTLLLDEITDMSLGAQAKLLRVLEESKVRRLGSKREIPVSVRVLAATNRPPEQAIENRHLRQDLYYRLNVFRISMPPLREHAQDIPAISKALIARLNKKHGCQVTGMSREVLTRFMANPWPGNVRQLRNRLERAVILARKGDIELRHLPPVSQPFPLRDTPADVLQVRVGLTLGEVEDAYVRLTFERVNQNKSRAAALLGICRDTLKQKLRGSERQQAPGARAARS